jgi:hypothetical protein
MPPPSESTRAASRAGAIAKPVKWPASTLRCYLAIGRRRCSPSTRDGQGSYSARRRPRCRNCAQQRHSGALPGSACNRRFRHNAPYPKLCGDCDRHDNRQTFQSFEICSDPDTRLTLWFRDNRNSTSAPISERASAFYESSLAGSRFRSSICIQSRCTPNLRRPALSVSEPCPEPLGTGTGRT